MGKKWPIFPTLTRPSQSASYTTLHTVPPLSYILFCRIVKCRIAFFQAWGYWQGEVVGTVWYLNSKTVILKLSTVKQQFSCLVYKVFFELFVDCFFSETPFYYLFNRKVAGSCKKMQLYIPQNIGLFLALCRIKKIYGPECLEDKGELFRKTITLLFFFLKEKTLFLHPMLEKMINNHTRGIRSLKKNTVHQDWSLVTD